MQRFRRRRRNYSQSRIRPFAITHRGIRRQSRVRRQQAGIRSPLRFCVWLVLGDSRQVDLTDNSFGASYVRCTGRGRGRPGRQQTNGVANPGEGGDEVAGATA